MQSTNLEKETNAWVDEYSDMLFNYARVRVNDHDLAKDLVQDTFVSALKAYAKFEGKSTVKTWLFSILKRKIIDHWRKQESRKTQPISYFQQEGMMKGKFLETHAPQGRLNEIETEIENRELGDALTACIQNLPAKWQGIVRDKLVEDKKSEVVCNEHEITASNLWVIIHRAKTQLRDCLEHKWFKL
jgi:RNA polymerase sigma-70 factor (TIGR02943 family)